MAIPLEERVKTLEALVKTLSSQRATPAPGIQGVSHLKLPKTVTLCGEKVPLEDPEVRQRIEFEFLLMLQDRAQVTIWQRRANGIFPRFETRLKGMKACEDLKYLALIESGLRPRALSTAKAKGYWQFIPSTGKVYDLKATSNWDERSDLTKSTDAAITFLGELHERFGSWPLAMAAYNTGPSRLSNSIAAQHVNNYWRLRLYREAERYVPRVIAAKIIMSDVERWGFSSRATPGWSTGDVDYVRVRLKKNETLSLEGVANGGGFDYRALTRLNPELSGGKLSGPVTVSFEVPKGKAVVFRAWVKKSIKKVTRRQSLRRVAKKKRTKRRKSKSKRRGYYTVSRGD
ncbi:MAG: lytic transglycosylase domain-containing protein, partial [Bradymonadia bacterium]